MSICYLTCCSKNKTAGGEGYEKYHYLHEADRAILRTRADLRRRISTGIIQGNLRSSHLGPDFGSTEQGLYLPAKERYNPGSFLSSLFRALGGDKDLHKLWFDENALFFISGLYGLVEANEPIQNYDVRIENTKHLWNKTILTRHLKSLVDPFKYDLILDCTAQTLSILN